MSHINNGLKTGFFELDFGLIYVTYTSKYSNTNVKQVV